MGNVIDSTGQMIDKINDILKTKKDAVINIVNDKLTLSVFALLEHNLKNVKEINFVIRDTKFVPDKSEVSHEFEMSPNDIVEKNKLKHFAKAKAMHDFIKAHVNVKKVNSKIKIGGNVILIDADELMLTDFTADFDKKYKVEDKRYYRNSSEDKKQPFRHHGREGFVHL